MSGEGARYSCPGKPRRMRIWVGGERPGPCPVPTMLQGGECEAGPGVPQMRVRSVVVLLGGLPGGRSKGLGTCLGDV